jgi:hypothetical protein
MASDLLSPEPVLLLGNGPSVDQVKQHRLAVPVISMNRTWRVRMGDHHVMIDRDDFWREFRSLEHKPSTLFVYKPSYREGDRLRLVSADDATTGNLTGLYAIHIAAFVLKFNPLCLIGYDLNKPGERGSHCKIEEKSIFGEPVERPVDRSPLLKFFGPCAEVLKRNGIKVYNCNPDSAIPHWPYMPLEELYR